MKNTVSINLGGMVYHIDEDAYVVLKSYLDRIKDEIRDLEGNHEIYSDIESRIAELINEKFSNFKQVVTLFDVEEIISIMGKPEDISGKSKSKRSYSSYRKSKRMYRDPDNRIIGGVCSGLAAYLDQDVTIIRVIFVLLAFFGMAGGFIYIILWIVLPEANTIAQRLEMRGEEVTLNSIIDFFKEEFENVKRSFKKR